MQCSDNFIPSALSTDFDLSPCFDVVIAYEDFETGKHAKRTYDFLTEHLSNECTFSNQMWKFDVLGIPNLRQMAAQDASQADIVIISCHGDQPLPAEVKAWIELWISGENHPVALVALFDETTISNLQVHGTTAYLRQVATRVGMEFFAQPSVKSDTNELRLESKPGAPAIQASLFPNLPISRRQTSFARWGINE
jgi:hypothetical protein